MSDLAPDGDLATWIEVHGAFLAVDALVLLNQICAQLQKLSEQGLEHHDVVATKVLLRSEEDGLVPVLVDLASPEAVGDGGLDRLLWMMLAGEPAPVTGVPQLGGTDELSNGFNQVFALLAAHGSSTTDLQPVRSALNRLANQARSAQEFTPVPIAVPLQVHTERREDREEDRHSEPTSPAGALIPRSQRWLRWCAVLAVALILLAAVMLIG